MLFPILCILRCQDLCQLYLGHLFVHLLVPGLKSHLGLMFPGGFLLVGYLGVVYMPSSGLAGYNDSDALNGY